MKNWNGKNTEQEWMGDAKMTQEEMEQVIAKIEHSADDIEVPESLEPEAVKRKLRSGRKRFSLRRMRDGRLWYENKIQ